MAATFSLRRFALSPVSRRPGLLSTGRIQTPCLRCVKSQVRRAHTPAEDPNWTSIVDNPAKLVRTGGKHGYGLIILAIIPITAFALGTWQVQRLEWKSNLIAKYEDRLIKPPLPLPPIVDPESVGDFEYRRVYAKGRLRHDKEMLIGPRMQEGKDGYLVVTPLERGEGESTILVNRGWIAKTLEKQSDRPEGLPQEEVVIEGLLRSPWKKNMFTPDNKPEEGKFYFPDVKQMAELTGSQPVWIEETMVQDLLSMYNREDKGIPIGRTAEVHLRNNHAQYIFTWYGLSLATAIMLGMVIKKKPNEAVRRVRQNKSW
ncbi:surf-like protein [Microsporum audouinii]